MSDAYAHYFEDICIPIRPLVNNNLLTRMARYVSSETDEHGCRPWTGTIKSGYGQITAGRRYTLRAHRVIWVIANDKEVPPGMVINHICENRACVAIEHLEAVGAQENFAHSRRTKVDPSERRRTTPRPAPVVEAQQADPPNRSHRRYTSDGLLSDEW